MIIEWAVDTRTGDLIFSGKVSKSDFQEVKLDPIDHKIVFGNPIETAPDFLLCLEILARRLIQQHSHPHSIITPITSASTPEGGFSIGDDISRH